MHKDKLQSWVNDLDMVLGGYGRQLHKKDYDRLLKTRNECNSILLGDTVKKAKTPESAKITISKSNLEAVLAIANEGNINDLSLIYDNSSGIGYTLSVEFKSKVGGKSAKTCIEVCGSENW